MSADPTPPQPGALGPWPGRRLGMVVVRGRSMEPTLHEGDRLLVLHGGRPRTGRLLVVRLAGVLAVKRAVARRPEGWWVERDNPAQGVDSWSVGAVPEHDVVAVVLTRLPSLRRRRPALRRWGRRAPRGRPRPPRPDGSRDSRV